MTDVQLIERLVTEFHSDSSGTGFIALVHQHFHESGLVEFTIDDNLLAFLDVDAHTGNQFRIVAKDGLFHEEFLPRMIWYRYDLGQGTLQMLLDGFTNECSQLYHIRGGNERRIHAYLIFMVL